MLFILYESINNSDDVLHNCGALSLFFLPCLKFHSMSFVFPFSIALIFIPINIYLMIHIVNVYIQFISIINKFNANASAFMSQHINIDTKKSLLRNIRQLIKCNFFISDFSFLSILPSICLFFLFHVMFFAFFSSSW